MADQMDVHNEVSGTVVGNVIQARDVTVSLPAARTIAVSGLPAQPVFIGRDTELAGLADVLNPAGAETAVGPVVVSAVAGLAGVGKTALAVRAAHDAIAAGWFSGGVLMVDLRGYDPPERRIQPTAALASLLDALGMPSEHIPFDQPDRERLWRTVLARHHASGQRMLILLDNASNAEQVRPLLPGTDGHRVVVTSRHSLADLDGARLFDVDVFSSEHAAALLQRELAAARPEDDRVHADPRAASQLGQLCGGLPLAIRIAAALLAADPDQPIAELTDALTTEHRRLEELNYDGSLSVRAAFDLSYQQLAPEPARLFRLLALNPGPEISTEAAAALVNLNIIESRRLIGQLRRAHLVHPGTVRGRWRMHDLVRLYTAGRVSRDSRDQEEPALERLLNYYLVNAQAAGRHFGGQAPISERARQFATWQHAVEWLDIENPNLIATITLAHDTGRSSYALHMPLALYPHFHLRKHWNDWITTHRVAVIAAQQLHDLQGEGFALTNLGSALRDLGRFDEAIDCLQQSLTVHQDASNLYGKSRALSQLGSVYRGLGRLDDALRYHRQALEIRSELRHRDGEANTLAGLGADYHALGQLNEALDCHLQALNIRQGLRDRHGEGRTLTDIGTAYRDLRNYDKAVDYFLQSIQIHREVSDRHGEGRTLINLGRTYRDIGHLDQAMHCYQQSLTIHRDLNDPRRNGTTLADIGDTYHEWGYHQEAVNHWQQALAILEVLPGPIAASRAAQLRAVLTYVGD